MENFSVSHGKRPEKLFRRSEKSLKKRIIRMKKATVFFAGGRKNAEKHGKRSWKIYRIIRKKHEKYTADRNKFCHWRTVGLKKRIFPPEKSREKSKKIRNPHKKIPKMLKKHAGIFSGFCTKNILFCTNSEKFCTKTWDSSGKNRRKYERKLSETPRNSTVRNRKMMKFYAKKGKKPPPLPETITKSE